MKVSQGYYKVYKFGGFAGILRQYANSSVQKQLISTGNSEKYKQKKHFFAIFFFTSCVLFGRIKVFGNEVIFDLAEVIVMEEEVVYA